MKILKNMIKLKLEKMMKISSYSHKIGHFTYDFRVFSYIFWVFFGSERCYRKYESNYIDENK